MVVVLLLAIQCRCCSQIFYLCQSCYRGQCYCCDLCRSTTQREARRQAQQRYRQTEKGRKAHCRAEQRRRQRKNNAGNKNMDDEGSIPAASHGSILVTLVENSICCCCCGARGPIVNAFPRRGYGRSSFRGSAGVQSSQIRCHYANKTASQPRTCP